MQLQSVTFVILTVFTLISMIRGAPSGFQRNIHSRAVNREQLKDYVQIGYHYVKKEVAEEYNKVSTLLEVPASGVRLGEGAYIAPNLKDFKPPAGYWKCEIAAHKDDFKAMPKLWIPEGKQSKPREGKDIPALNKFIHSKKKSVRATILFSTMKPGDPGLQMLIPPSFLKDIKSTAPFNEKAYDIYAACEAADSELLDPETSKVDWKKLWPDVEFPK